MGKQGPEGGATVLEFRKPGKGTEKRVKPRRVDRGIVAAKSRVALALKGMADDVGGVFFCDPTTSPDKKSGVTAILGGQVVQDVNPAALTDNAKRAKERGQSEVYATSVLMGSQLSLIAPRNTTHAAEKLVALGKTLLEKAADHSEEDDDSDEASKKNGASKKLFMDVTRILLTEVFGTSYRNNLNDARVNMVVNLLKEQATFARIQGVLNNFLQNRC